MDRHPVENDPVRQTISHSAEATAAFHLLIKHNAHPASLKAWLSMLSPPSKDLLRNVTRVRRNAERLARTARKLADEVEREARTARLIMVKDTLRFPHLIDTLPRLLREYAEVWPGAFLKPSMFGPADRFDLVIMFLKFVKKETGRYHYREVADILNAMDEVPDASEKSTNDSKWTEITLRQLAYRERKHQRPPALYGTRT